MLPLSQYSTAVVFQLDEKLLIKSWWPEKNSFTKTFSTGLLNKKFSSLIAKQQSQLFGTAVQSKQSPRNANEFLLNIGNNNFKWFELKFKKQSRFTIVSAVNIHQQKKALAIKEAALKNDVKHYQSLLEHLPIAATYKTLNGYFYFINKAFTETLGFTLKDIPTVEDWIIKSCKSEADAKIALKYWKKDFAILKKGGTTKNRVLHVYTKKGEEKFIELNAVLHNNLILTTYNDITEKHKEARSVIRERETFQKFIDNLPFPFVSCTVDYELTYINKRFTEVFGYTFNEIKPYNVWFKRFKWNYPEHESDHDKEFYATLAFHKQNAHLPIPLIRREVYAKDDSIRLVEIHFGSLHNQIFGIVNDVTEQTKIQHQLKESHERFKRIAENIPLPFIAANLDLSVNFANKRFYEFTGVKLEEIKTFDDWYKFIILDDPKDKEKNLKAYYALLAEHKSSPGFTAPVLRRRFRNKNGEIKDINLNFSIFENQIFCIIEDITERIVAEEKIKESERLFKALINNIAVPVACYDANTMKCVFINKPFIKTLGYQLHEVRHFEEWYSKLAYTDKEVRHKDSLIWQKAVEDRRNRRSTEVALFERPVRCKDGSIKLFEISFTVNENLVYGLFKDITQQKQAEALLKESEQRFRTLAEDMPIAIGSHDFNGKVVFFNKHFIKSTGYTYEDLPTLKDWYKKTQPNPTIRKQFYENWLQVIKNYRDGIIKEQPYIEASSMCKNGTFKTFNYLFSIVNDVVYIILVDITELRKAENEISASHKHLRELTNHLQQVREDERKYIAREIHDELGQLITGLKLDISIARKKIEKTMPEMAEKLNETIELTDRIVKTVRRISTELRPPILDDVGLAAAIEWESKEFTKRTGIKCTFSDKKQGVQLAIDKKSNLFRIFQESLTNVMRHSNATEVKVLLELRKDKMALCIEDNGKGFAITKQSKTLGLLGMRERSIELGGIYNIESQPGKGTKICVEIPI